MLVIVGGSKGGVGKSIVAAVTYDYFLNKKDNTILVETDTNNPDVFKAYTKKNFNGNPLEIHAENVTKDKGWENLLNIFDSANRDGRDVVVNTAAENIDAIQRSGASLNLFDGDIVTLWVANDKLDSIILLREYVKVVKQRVCVVKNLCFGSESDFKIYDDSKLAKELGIPSVYFPELTDSVQDAFYNKRSAIFELDDVLTLGGRLLARPHLNYAFEQIEEALKIAVKV